jgi:DNA modification methylase
MTVQPYTLHSGDCRDILPQLPDNSVDAIICDPPYELGFMGKQWDSSGIAYNVAMWEQCLRVLKPGGHLLAFGGTRTYHRMTVAIEDAGFQIRDCLNWLYGQGMPKGSDIGKQLDKRAGKVRQVIGSKLGQPGYSNTPTTGRMLPLKKTGNNKGYLDITQPATPEGQQWDGWQPGLKPAHELICMARKPFKGSLLDNVLTHGTGALHTGACRNGEIASKPWGKIYEDRRKEPAGFHADPIDAPDPDPSGRFPANLLLTHDPNCQPNGTKRIKSNGAFPKNVNSGGNSVVFRSPQKRAKRIEMGDENGMETVADYACVDGCPVKAINEQSGNCPTGTPGKMGQSKTAWFGGGQRRADNYYNDSGGASRYFNTLDWDLDDFVPFLYSAKPSKKEKNAGLQEDNDHVTVKPVKVLQWLHTLVTPPGGVILDPFLGSGSGGVAAMQLWNQYQFRFIGIELEPDHMPLAQLRIGHAWEQVQGPSNSQLSIWDLLERDKK